jgi:hypothetical protein
LAVRWHDPNSVKENNVTSSSCNATWSWDGVTSAPGENNTYSTQFSLCYEALPNYFEMKFSNFVDAKNFTLEIAHHYKDDEYASPLPLSGPLEILDIDQRSQKFHCTMGLPYHVGSA